MKLLDDDLHIWSVVAATVHPLPGRRASASAGTAAAAPPVPPPVASPPSVLRTPRPAPTRRPSPIAPQTIEPGRYRRLVLGRESIGGRLDLHGFDQDRARAALTEFVVAAVDRGARGVLVITGKGTLGDGVLRRQVPEWLAAPPLRAVIAGLSEAHRRHGGGGALYVALKRRGR